MLVTCRVTIIGLWSHSGTGEEWADDDNGMTSADAQAFKRACSCFGLGRYFYDIAAIWVDLDQHRQPARTPVLPAWVLPENWRKGMRPSGKNGKKTNPAAQSADPNGCSTGNNGRVAARRSQPTNGSGSNGQNPTGKTNSSAETGPGDDDLDARILCMEKTVGTAFYRRILREYGRVNQPTRPRLTSARQFSEIPAI